MNPKKKMGKKEGYEIVTNITKSRYDVSVNMLIIRLKPTKSHYEADRNVVGIGKKSLQ